MYLTYLISCINFKAAVIFATLINFGYTSKSPLTAVNLVDVVQYHVDRFTQSFDKTLQENLILLSNIADHIFINSTEILFNNSCAQSLNKLRKDITTSQFYALRILDSWGKPESGILEGNYKWEGRYYECISIYDDNEIAGQYCSVSINILINQSPLKSSIALCLPDSCSVQNISALMSFLSLGTVDQVTCFSSENTWFAKDIIGIIVICFLGLMIILSTIYDCLTNGQFKKSMMLDAKGNYIETTTPANTSTRHQLLLSFSVIRNTKDLLDTTQKPIDITCLHGLRFLSMTWVMLGHTVLFFMNNADNLVTLAHYVLNRYEYQVAINSSFAVDSFFFLSGLLVVYLGLRQLNKSKGKMNVPLMYLHRYLRLTPPYAFVILISISLYPKLAEGPFFSDLTQPLIIFCEKYWYTNLLYFSNFYPLSREDECLSWGWYLSVDTQFYLLAPFILWFLYRYPKVGLGLIAFLFFSSITITGIFSFITKQQSSGMNFGLMAWQIFQLASSGLVGGNVPDTSSNETTYSEYIEDIYRKPWARIGAYVVGMAIGYILFVTRNKVKMNKITVVFGWISAAIVNYLIIYCCYPYYSKGEQFSNNLAAFYNAVSRPVWCVGLAWVVIACVSGYGGPVNKLLSWKAFIPLSRLTYCSYLLHPLVLDWFIGATEVQPHFSVYFFVVAFIFTVVFTTMLAYVVAMLVEFPFIKLLKILQSGTKRYETAPPEEVTHYQIRL